MRICLLQPQGHMYSGGQGVYLHYLSRELARLGHDVHVIAGLPYPDVSPDVQLHGLKNFSLWSMVDRPEMFAFHTHPLEYFHPTNFYELVSTRFSLSSILLMFSLRAYEKLNELEREKPFDIIHDNQTLAYGVWLMKERGRPVVANVHHPLTIDQSNTLRDAPSILARFSRLAWFPWYMQRIVAPRLDRIITGSDASAASVVKAFDLPRSKVQVIHDGVDAAVFRPLKDDTPEPYRVLFVGHTEDRNKGIDYLLRALQLLRLEVPFKLTIVHRPGSRRVHRLVQQYGLYGKLTFLENLSTEELVRQYNRAQLLASPSLYEGFGLPAVEAAACGTPVVATTAGALAEMVEDGVTGLLVPPGDVAALARALRTLLEDPARCRVMGEAGARRVRERFNWRRTAEETVCLYEEVIGRSGTVPKPAPYASAEPVA